MSTADELIKYLRQPVEVVLSYDIEKLRRLDANMRASLWNQIRTNREALERDLVSHSSPDIRSNDASDFTFAGAMLAVAARANDEKTPLIHRFSGAELDMVSDFERYNVFDLLSTEEIADRMARRRDVYDVAVHFYRDQYSKLDTILDSQVKLDLKIAFQRRYRERLDKIVKGVQAYIDKNGTDAFVGQVDEGSWGPGGARIQKDADVSPG